MRSSHCGSLGVFAQGREKHRDRHVSASLRLRQSLRFRSCFCGYLALQLFPRPLVFSHKFSLPRFFNSASVTVYVFMPRLAPGLPRALAHTIPPRVVYSSPTPTKPLCVFAIKLFRFPRPHPSLPSHSAFHRPVWHTGICYHLGHGVTT